MTRTSSSPVARETTAPSWKPRTPPGISPSSPKPSTSGAAPKWTNEGTIGSRTCNHSTPASTANASTACR
ncbi:hypothetical protein ACFQ60_04930 [Streptomyces zhihengii]